MPVGMEGQRELIKQSPMSTIDSRIEKEELKPNRRARRATAARARRARPDRGESFEHKLERNRQRVTLIQERKAERLARQSPASPKGPTKAQQKAAAARERVTLEKQSRRARYAAKAERKAA